MGSKAGTYWQNKADARTCAYLDAMRFALEPRAATLRRVVRDAAIALLGARDAAQIARKAGRKVPRSPLLAERDAERAKETEGPPGEPSDD